MHDTREPVTGGPRAPCARGEDDSGAAPGTVAQDSTGAAASGRAEWSNDGHATEPSLNSREQASSRARALLDWLPQGVVVTDRHDRVVYINRRAEQLFDYRDAEVAGQPLELMLSTAPGVERRIGRRRDGRGFAIDVRRTNVEFNGDCLRIHVVDAAPLADTVLLDKREFLVDVAHELRAPVATIRASTEVLVDALASSLSDGLLLLLHNLEHEADRLASLIDNLLDLNTIRAGRGRLHRVRCDLGDLAREAVLSILPLARRRDQSVSLSLPPAPVWARVDAPLVERAMVNLVSNAHKYGAEAGRIGVRLESDATSACFSVEDDGPGIPEDDRERIFERLYRGADAQARRIQGSGLGLALCRAVVDLHGGRVAVAEGALGGSVFTIELPLGL